AWASGAFSAWQDEQFTRAASGVEDRQREGLGPRAAAVVRDEDEVARLGHARREGGRRIRRAVRGAAARVGWSLELAADAQRDGPVLPGEHGVQRARPARRHHEAALLLVGQRAAERLRAACLGRRYGRGRG